MSQHTHVQSVPNTPTRTQRIKRYVRENARPLTYGVLLGVAGSIVYVKGSNWDKSLLILKNKSLKKFADGPTGDGNMPGVEYTVRGTRLWLLPAMLPVEETPYV